MENELLHFPVTMPENNELSTYTSENYKEIEALFLAQTDVRAKSKKSYKYNLDQFFKWIGKTGRALGRLSVEDIIQFKQDLLTSGKSPLTVATYLNTVHQFYDWCEATGRYPNIAKRVKSHNGAMKGFQKMHLSNAECRALLREVREDKDRNALRNYAMVSLILHTGLRTIEVCRADYGDIKYKRGKRILKVWGKGHDTKDSEVIIVDEVWNAICEYIAARGPVESSSPLFATNGNALSQQRTRLTPRNVQLIIKKHLRAIGLDGHEYSAHSLRHTTAVEIIHNGGTLQDVQWTLRHSSGETSKIYLESIEEEQRFERAPEELLEGIFGKINQ